MKDKIPGHSSRIRSTRGQREVILPTWSPQPQICKHQNRTHILISRDSIQNDSIDITIKKPDYNNNQQPIDVLFTEV